MPVLGVGGFFFRVKDPGALSTWYDQHIGIGPTSPDEYAWSTRGGPLVFAAFESTTDYWPADKQVMINLRVSDLEDNPIELWEPPA